MQSALPWRLRKCSQGEERPKNETRLTSRNDPHTASADRERIDLATLARGHVHGDLALVNEECQLHPPAVFGALEPAWRNLDEAGTKKGQREDFRIAEI
jgi:hypothetical protein